MSAPARDEGDNTLDAVAREGCCLRFEDLFGPASGELISRFLSNFLESLVITPTELLHSAKAQKRLGDAGRVMMNAVDKIATLQAKVTGQNAAQRLKVLDALVGEGVRRLWDDERDHPAAAITPESFSVFVDGLRATGFDRDYAINRALAEYLSQFRVWRDKVDALLALHAQAWGDHDRYVVRILAECFRSDVVLDQVFGPFERLEERCDDLILLWKGEWAARPTAFPGLETVNTLIATGAVPEIRASVEYSLLRALAAKDPIRSVEPEEEIRAVFELFRRLWTGSVLIGGPKAMSSLERRQARHLSREGVTDLLRDRKVVAERYAFLLQLCGVAVGPLNRATLRTFIEHYFRDKDFVPRAIGGAGPAGPKAQALTRLHRMLRASWLTESDRVVYAAQVEAAQGLLLRESRLFEQLDGKTASPSQKVLTLVDLCRKGTFIEGDILNGVRARIEALLRDPAFLPDYLGGAVGEERQRKLALLSRALGGVGVTPPDTV